MKEPSIASDKFFKSACYFESSLIVVALILGWIADIDPFAALIFNEPAIVNGIIGTLPLCLLLMALNQLPITGLQAIRHLLQQTLGPSLAGRHWTDL